MGFVLSGEQPRQPRPLAIFQQFGGGLAPWADMYGGRYRVQEPTSGNLLDVGSFLRELRLAVFSRAG